MLAAGGAPELVSEALIGETSLLEAGAEVVPEATESVLTLVLVTRVVDEGEPVTGPSVAEVALGSAPVLVAPISVEDPGMAPVSTDVAEVEVTDTTVVVLVESSEVLAGTMELEYELSVLRPGEEDGEEAGTEDGYELGRVEAREKVACAADSTERAFHEAVGDDGSGAGEEDSGAV